MQALERLKRWAKKHDSWQVRYASLLVAALAVRLAGITRHPLWYDEAFSARVATLPPVQIVWMDLHPPLWHLLEWLVTHTLGSSELALRLPGAVFGALVVAEFYLLVRALAGEREALWAAGLLTIMPAQINFAQDARMYSLLTLFVVVAARAMHEKRWARFWLASALMLYTHNIGVIYLAAIGLLAVIKDWRAGIAALVKVGVVWLPWAAVLVIQLANEAHSQWIIPPDVARVLFFYPLYTTFFVTVPPDAQWLVVPVSYVLTVLSVYGLLRHARQLALLFALAFGSLVILSLVSLAWRSLMIPRVMLPAGTALAALWGVFLARQAGVRRHFALALLATALGVSLVALYSAPDEEQQPFGTYAELVADGYRAGDAVYALDAHSYTLFYYYDRGRFPLYLLPTPGETQADSVASRETRQATLRHLRQAGFQRVWLLWSDRAYPPDSTTQAELSLDTARILGVYMLTGKYGQTYRVLLIAP